jgi:hypothetical protein
VQLVVKELRVLKERKVLLVYQLAHRVLRGLKVLKVK